MKSVMAMLFSIALVVPGQQAELVSSGSHVSLSPQVNTAPRVTQENDSVVSALSFDSCRLGDENQLECPSGSVVIGDPVNCWAPGSEPPVFQEFQNGVWISVGTGEFVPASAAWGDAGGLYDCADPSFQFEPSIVFEATESGLKAFRWMVDAEPSEEFEVLFINPAVEALRGQGPSDGEFSAWTKLMSNGKQIKFYAKYLKPGQKVQFMVQNKAGNYKQFAWSRIEADDLDSSGAYVNMQNHIYFIRTLDLEPGKNRIRILVDGKLIWGTKTYTIKDPLGVNLSRSEIDQPDAVRGFQIKPIYLVPKGVQDKRRDTDGTILDSLNEGNAYLKSQLNREFEFDVTASGTLDVGFIQSEYTASQIESIGDDYFGVTEGLSLRDLLEGTAFAEPTDSRKSYTIFVEGVSAGDRCGLGDRPGQVNVVFLSCDEAAYGLDAYYSLAWVHEVFHNLGVEHVNSRCDLMSGGAYAEANPCYTNEPRSIDPRNQFYVNSDRAGVDIMKLRVWKGGNINNSELQGVCDSVTDGSYTCDIGEVTIGSAYYCYSRIRSAELQVYVDETWEKMADGQPSQAPWGDALGWRCSPGYVAPSAKVTIDQAFRGDFRWVVNGRSSESFSIQFQW